MNNNLRKALLPILGAVVVGLSMSAAMAGPLVYQPINPSFGGDPFIGNHLLNKAQAQDNYRDPNARSLEPLSATERLVQNLESRLISQLITDVGRGELNQGSFDSSDFGVVVRDEGGLLVLRITDKVTGDTTDISVGGAFTSGF